MAMMFVVYITKMYKIIYAIDPQIISGHCEDCSITRLWRSKESSNRLIQKILDILGIEQYE